jgi:hypothetical protein
MNKSTPLPSQISILSYINMDPLEKNKVNVSIESYRGRAIILDRGVRTDLFDEVTLKQRSTWDASVRRVLVVLG